MLVDRLHIERDPSAISASSWRLGNTLAFRGDYREFGGTQTRSELRELTTPERTRLSASSAHESSTTPAHSPNLRCAFFQKYYHREHTIGANDHSWSDASDGSVSKYGFRHPRRGAQFQQRSSTRGARTMATSRRTDSSTKRSKAKFVASPPSAGNTTNSASRSSHGQR